VPAFAPTRPESDERIGSVEKVFVPLQVLVSARRVEEAAVTVMFPAPVKSVPLMLAPGERAEAVAALPPMLSVLVETAYETPLFAPTRPVKVARVGALVKVWVPPQVFEVVVLRAEEMVMAPVAPVVWSG
jgi:hypothetical protein